METARARPRTTGPVVTILLAGGAAVLLGVSGGFSAVPLSGRRLALAEFVATTTFLLGWTFATGAAVAAVVSVVRLVRGLHRRVPPVAEVLLVVVATVVVLALFAAHPLVGTGSGSA